MPINRSQGLRSAKYAAKYGVGFKVPNPIVRKSKEVSPSACLPLSPPFVLPHPIDLTYTYAPINRRSRSTC